MAEKSYDDPVKETTRKILRGTIRKKFGLQRKNIKVVCFPGKEALELKIYDSLGISRNNIVGLEKDERIYRHLKNEDLGIHLFNLEDEDFFEKTNEKFDVISLDYMGYLTDKKVKTFSLIGKKRLLNDESILFTNFQARRENKKAFEIYQKAVQMNDKDEYVSNVLQTKEECFIEEKFKSDNLDERLDRLNEKGFEIAVRKAAEKDERIYNEVERIAKDLINNPEKLKKEISIEEIFQAAEKKNGSAALWNGDELVMLPKKVAKDEARDIGVPLEILTTLAMESPRYEKSVLYLRFLDFIKAKEIRQLIREMTDCAQGYDKLLNEFSKVKGKVLRGEDLRRPVEEKQEILSELGNNRFFYELFKLFSKNVFAWSETHTYLASLYDLNCYFPDKIRLFKYLSDAGTPMECNLFEMTTTRRKLSPFKEYYERFFEVPLFWWIDMKEMTSRVIKGEKRENLEKIIPQLKSDKDYLLYYQKYLSEFSEEILNSLGKLSQDLYSEIGKLKEGKIKREFLGSSLKPKFESEVVARELIEGVSEEEIHKKYRISNNELGAVKAWITMGKYDYIKKSIEEKNQPKIQEIKQEEPKLEDKLLPIYRDILSGLSDEKIKEKYNLENMALAGYKASIKRGGRENLVNKAMSESLELNKERIIEIIYSKIKEKGIGYFSKGIDVSKEIINLQKEHLNVNEIHEIEDKGLYILSANNGYSNESLKKIEDICLSSDKLNPPAILVISDSSQIKDKLKESVKTLQELGLISRIFYYNNNHSNQSKSLNEILGESYLVR